MNWKCCAMLIINCYYYITVNNIIADRREMQCVLFEGLK